MNSKKLKTLVVLTVLILLSAALAAAYFYETSEQNKTRAREAEIQTLKKNELALREDIAKFQKRQKTVIHQNLSLRDQTRVFEDQKKVIVGQVRSSVASFETFRQSATEEIGRLKTSADTLETEKKSTEEKLRSLENLSKAEKEKLTSEVSALSRQIEELKATASQLAENLKSKDRVSMVAETAKLHYNLGNFYFRNHDYSNAAREYKEALFYRPDDAVAQFNLAVTSDDFLDDRPTAISHYKRYLELKPADPARKKIQQRILDLELRDRVIDEPARKETRDVFKSGEDVFSKFNLTGDKR